MYVLLLKRAQLLPDLPILVKTRALLSLPILALGGDFTNILVIFHHHARDDIVLSLEFRVHLTNKVDILH